MVIGVRSGDTRLVLWDTIVGMMYECGEQEEPKRYEVDKDFRLPTPLGIETSSGVGLKRGARYPTYCVGTFKHVARHVQRSTRTVCKIIVSFLLTDLTCGAMFGLGSCHPVTGG